MPPFAAIVVSAALLTTASAAPGFEAAVGLLDSPSLTERETAAARLLGNDAFTLADAERLLASGSLSPEQRLRLERIGLTLFGRMPRAGLGVQFGQPIRGEGAPLAAIVPDFPAAEFLRPGDLVRTINGAPVANTNHMGSVILSHGPGETLRLEIDRPLAPAVNPGVPPPFERLTLDVPLGRFEDLNNGRPTAARIEAAYQQRLARAGADRTPPVIGAGLGPLEWLRAEGYDEQRAEAPSIATSPVSAWRVVSFGGQPASSVADIELRRGDEHAMLRRSNIALQADGVYDRIEETLAAYRALVRRLAQLRTLVDAPGPGEADPRGVRRIERVNAERAELETELRSIVRMLEGGPQADGLSPEP